MSCAARIAPAADRNKESIRQVLAPLLGPLNSGTVLEVASGTGQHVAFFAENFPGLIWQPTDVDASNFESIQAHCERRENVLPPKVLDCSSNNWPLEDSSVAAVLCSNLTHISPFSATQGLIKGASQALEKDGLLFIYGPFKVNGEFTTESNRAFHESLVGRDPEWGYRDISDIETLATARGFLLEAMKPMPANNFSLIFRKQTE
eukprot:CAMPEP_0177583856 /NCGR_PEP_ID=MMETSP0419_2-20121207/3559_1 /TAXON_ID=582737 /ORGANISM="Tetraselmis sp., Strain GSL018" /LENGTH=204 /DNA_ID=CAMNT_0019073303 /DNA_START=86 /DNA_END=700 /DNA_ORIENTATION=+